MRKILFMVISLPIALGIITGFYFGGQYLFDKAIYKEISGHTVVLAKGQEFGFNDKKSTRDTAIGILIKNKDLAKGTHKLIRGSDALDVYLTSSVIDLDQFVERGVQIWGETYQRKNIGWFMDVVKLKLIK